MLNNEFSHNKAALIKPYMDKGDLNVPIIFVKFGKVPIQGHKNY